MKAVIFDFGGVLVRTASWARREAWEHRLGLAPGASERLVFGGEDGKAVQHGRISAAEHWRHIGRRLGVDDATLAEFRQDFYAEDGLDEELLAYAGRLRGAGFHVGLLSNASGDARTMFRERYGLDSQFDSMTISGEEGVMKPDPRIFRIALERAGAEPHEAIFVDDFEENIEGARQVGMVAVRFCSHEQSVRELASLTGVK